MFGLRKLNLCDRIQLLVNRTGTKANTNYLYRFSPITLGVCIML